MIAHAANLPSPSPFIPRDPENFFNTARDAFQRAAPNVGGAVERFFAIGGFTVRFRFAGDALVSFVTRAFAHLAIPAAPNPHLTIHFWDMPSTRVAMPPPPWGVDDYLGGGEIRALTNARYYTSFQIDSGILALIDLEQNVGYCWYKSPQQIPDYELAAPLRLPLYPWLMRNGILPVHAGAVGLREGGVLLVGKGGSGKSNTALACLASDLGYASDDFCLIDPKNLRVHSLYSTAKMHSRDLQRFPSFQRLVGNPDRMHLDKALFFLHEHFPEKILTRFPLRAILIPRLGNGQHARLVPASPAAALAALTPGTTLLLPSAAKATFRALADLVRHVPSFYLDLSPDISQIPPVILKWLRA